MRHQKETVMEELDRNQMDKLIKTLKTLSTSVSSIFPILKKIKTNTRQLQVSNSSMLDAVGPKLQEQFQNLEIADSYSKETANKRNMR